MVPLKIITGKRPYPFVYRLTGIPEYCLPAKYYIEKGDPPVKRTILILTAFLVSFMLLSSCTNDESNQIPADGTSVTNVSDAPVFLQAATDLQEHCDLIGGCTCFLDGLQTTCSLVFACLDAGFCELARE
jgi:hypothetical protein